MLSPECCGAGDHKASECALRVVEPAAATKTGARRGPTANRDFRIGYGGAASKRPRVRRNLPSAREHPAVGGKNNPLDRSLLGSS